MNKQNRKKTAGEATWEVARKIKSPKVKHKGRQYED